MSKLAVLQGLVEIKFKKIEMLQVFVKFDKIINKYELKIDI